MNIIQVDVSENQDVTLTMSGMPNMGVRTENTTVYIKGAPLGRPNEVSGTNQTIVFSAQNAVASGKISVKVAMEDGSQLTATSAVDYTIPEPNEGPDDPVVRNIVPRTASPGTTVTLMGSNLSHVDAVALQYSGSKNYMAPNPQASENHVKFRVPPDVPRLGGTYQISIRSKPESRMRRTPVSLTIDRVD